MRSACVFRVEGYFTHTLSSENVPKSSKQVEDVFCLWSAVALRSAAGLQVSMHCLLPLITLQGETMPSDVWLTGKELA